VGERARERTDDLRGRPLVAEPAAAEPAPATAAAAEPAPTAAAAAAAAEPAASAASSRWPHGARCVPRARGELGGWEEVEDFWRRGKGGGGERWGGRGQGFIRVLGREGAGVLWVGWEAGR
jgi:hypothetical protein